MNRIAPKPVISQIVRTWNIQPGMSFTVAEDVNGRLWIEESCPIGSHYWSVEQAAELTDHTRTGVALAEAVALCRERQALDRMPTLPVMDGEPAAAGIGSPRRQRRIASSHDSRLARV
jgi:hypothetical protein